MEKIIHTPGPWVIHGNFTEIHPHDDSDGNQVIADIDPDCEMDSREANARLIAAAPDLLAALEFALHLIETTGDFADFEVGKVIDEAINAIAKAKG